YPAGLQPCGHVRIREIHELHVVSTQAGFLQRKTGEEGTGGATPAVHADLASLEISNFGYLAGIMQFLRDNECRSRFFVLRPGHAHRTHDCDLEPGIDRGEEPSRETRGNDVDLPGRREGNRILAGLDVLE